MTASVIASDVQKSGDTGPVAETAADSELAATLDSGTVPKFERSTTVGDDRIASSPQLIGGTGPSSDMMGLKKKKEKLN